MTRRFLSALLAASLLLPLLAAPALAADSCTSGTNAGHHYVVQKLASQVQPTEDYPGFDAIVGEATVQDLDNCSGLALGAKGSYLLAANVQTISGRIYQMGYAENANGRGFIIADQDADVLYWLEGMNPVIGTRYRFRINLYANYVAFTLTNLSTGHTESVTGYPGSPGRATYAWWGVERQDTASNIGNLHANPDYDMSQMGYSMSNTAGFTYRTGLNINSVSNVGGQGHDFYKSSGLNGCHERHVETRTWTNDTVNFDSNGC